MSPALVAPNQNKKRFMFSNPLVTVVIVTYQSRHTIRQALTSIGPAVSNGFARCTVVDNASKDGTGEYVSSEFPWVNLICSAENLGFGRGCNLGCRDADTPYVMFLNPDASIDLDSLKRLVKFMDDHPGAGIAGPATFDTTANAFQSVGTLLTPAGLVRISLGLPGGYQERRSLRSGEPPFQTNWVCGSSMLVRTSVFRHVGGFDSRYFLYFEETDLCIQVRAANYEIWAVGDATAHHIGASSARKSGETLTDRGSGSIVEHFYRSRFYYLSKNFGFMQACVAEILARSIEGSRWLIRVCLGRNRTHDASPFRWPFLRLPAKLD